MSSKPTVILQMSTDVVEMMFTEATFAKLQKAASVEMPPDGDDGPRQDVRAVITGWGTPRFRAERLALYPNLGLISHSAGTVREIVGSEVFDRGIRVTTAASVNAIPVAEYTLAMIVMMLKQVPWLIRHVKAGGWGTDERPLRELRNMTVGLIGASRIGREVARRLLTYPGVKVKVYDPYLTKEQAKALGVTSATLDQVCQCEVVSVHAPSTSETRHLLDAERLALLPDHAVLINTSRGSLIDEAALAEESERRPLYVLLDVADPEPPAEDSPLLKLPNVLITPHIAGAMNQARKDMGAFAVEQILRFLSDKPLEDEVTRESLATMA